MIHEGKINGFVVIILGSLNQLYKVLLLNGGSFKRIFSYELSLHKKTNIIPNMTKIQTLSCLYLLSSCETRSLYKTFGEFIKYCFVMQPLENPPLCSNTLTKVWERGKEGTTYTPHCNDDLFSVDSPVWIYFALLLLYFLFSTCTILYL